MFTADHALLYPLLELACGRVHNVREYHLLYNVGTELNKRTEEYHCKEYLIERVLSGRRSMSARGSSTRG